MSKRKQLNEIAPALAAAGGAVLRTVGKPLLKYAGKKLFRKAAKAGIKKFGKGAVRTALNTGKEIIKDKAVRAAGKELATSGLNKIKNKFTKKPLEKETQESLTEKFSLIVKRSLESSNNFIFESDEKLYNDQYIFKPYKAGGIPDLAGRTKEFMNKGPWETPAHYQGKAYKFYSVVVTPYDKAGFGDDTEYTSGENSVVFFKAPAVMDKSKVEEKLEAYLRGYLNVQDIPDNISILRNISLINQVGKNVCPVSEWEQLTGSHFKANEGMKGISAKKEIKTKNRDEINEEIKAKAKALAKEKMRTLMSNGVSKEDALEAAKKAYKMFIDKFYKQSFVSANSSGGRFSRPSSYHPIISKSGSVIKQMREQNNKDAAVKKYNELVRKGISKEEARKRAIELYKN